MLELLSEKELVLMWDYMREKMMGQMMEYL
jgi:hypothetical protein